MHSGFMGQAGAGAGLVKSSYERFFCQQIRVLSIAGNWGQLVCYLEDVEVLLPSNILE
jgi:hypothetical protein